MRKYVETKKIEPLDFNKGTKKKNFKFLRAKVLLLAAMLLIAVSAFSQGVPLPFMQEQFLNGAGTSPAFGYKLCAYAANTLTLQAMYTDYTLSTPVNPLIFSTGGLPTFFAYVDPTKNYKYILRTAGSDATCNTGTVIWTRDNITFNTITNYWARSGGKLSPATNTDQVVVGASTTDSSAFIVGIPSLAAASASANASTLSLEWLTSNSTMAIRSGITGSGTYRNISVWTNSTQKFLFDTSGDFLVGLTAANNPGSSLIEGKASNTNGTSIDIWNPSVGSTAYADVFAVAGASAWGSNPAMHMGVTTTGYVTSGAYYASMGFLQSNVTATNGILVDAITGPIALRSNGTTELSITGNVGTSSAHYIDATGGFRALARAFQTPTEAGAMVNVYFDSGAASGFITSASYGPTTYFPLDIAASQDTFNISGSDVFKVVAGGFQWAGSPAVGGFKGNLQITSNGAPVYPTANTALLNLYYDGTADASFITSYNYGATTYKPLDVVSSKTILNISGTDSVWVVAGGFQWPTSPGVGGFKGNLQITSNGAPVYPTANVALLNLYYDGTADSSFVTSYNYGSSTYKPSVYASSSHRFNISGTDVMWVTSSGPQWKAGYSTSIGAGAQTLTMSNMSFPGSSPGNPCFMVTVLSSSGQVGYVPAFC